MSSSSHSVQGHLRVSVDEYDRAIRVFVPYYDELIATGVELLARLAPAHSHILELGSGTGRFSQAVLRGLPQATMTLLEIDADILKLARGRLAGAAEGNGERVQFLRASFLDPLPAADAIVASLSLHHVHDATTKAALYRSIRKALKPGGVFLCLDACVSHDPRLATLTFDHWIDFMCRSGLTADEARDHLKAWEKEDRYFPIYEELKAVAEAGFAAPECFWRRGPMAIYGSPTDAASAPNTIRSK